MASPAHGGPTVVDGLEDCALVDVNAYGRQQRQGGLSRMVETHAAMEAFN